MLGPNGVLYGVAEWGGIYGVGEVYELIPPSTAESSSWSFQPLFSFTGNDAANPTTLSLRNGVLYGTTLNLLASHGGTLFELKPPSSADGHWTETILHVFTGGTEGCYPMTPPLIMPDGSIYGATYGTLYSALGGYPGLYGDGTVFKLTPASSGGWTKSVIYDFGSSHFGPNSPLIVRNGAIFGIAGDTQTATGGEVFQLQPPASAAGQWTFNALYAFGENDVPGGPFAMGHNAIFGVVGNMASSAGVPCWVFVLEF